MKLVHTISCDSPSKATKAWQRRQARVRNYSSQPRGLLRSCIPGSRAVTRGNSKRHLRDKVYKPAVKLRSAFHEGIPSATFFKELYVFVDMHPWCQPHASTVNGAAALRCPARPCHSAMYRAVLLPVRTSTSHLSLSCAGVLRLSCDRVTKS